MEASKQRTAKPGNSGRRGKAASTDRRSTSGRAHSKPPRQVAQGAGNRGSGAPESGPSARADSSAETLWDMWQDAARSWQSAWRSWTTLMGGWPLPEFPGLGRWSRSTGRGGGPRKAGAEGTGESMTAALDRWLAFGLPSAELLDPSRWQALWEAYAERNAEVAAEWMDRWAELLSAATGKGPWGLPTELVRQIVRLSWWGLAPRLAADAAGKLARDSLEYWVDWWQRWVLYMDILRQRGTNMLEHYEAGMPPLLIYDYEVVLDARDFDRPCNYQLLAIKHPEGKEPAPGRRPIVIIDPRAGHGPGIGGFKRDSEVGMALTEGHPVYFVVFTPEPVPGQTIEDVELAQVRFIEEVYRRHPDRGRPIVYGNCQAGWAVAMLGADRPDVTGPIVINGAPLSYWAGGPGVNPMRVTGGIVGGAWATRWLCDLGNGIFDGAYLVMNFENLNPSNTLFKKDYNVFKDPEKERERFLDFERWWTGFYFLNEEEILWIVNNLFIGDKLEHGKLRLSPTHHVDIRNMDDPLVIFASSGDNITPPHQALHWISEVYEDTEDLKRSGQRIVYLLNPHVGHLGIFVSAKVARKEHRAIIEHIERIRQLEPGLYQMFIVGETGETDPLKDQFVVRFEERRIEDVRFPFDKRAFEKTAAVSRANEQLYLLFGRPLVRALTTPAVSMALKWLNPARVSRYVFSERVNPAMAMFQPLAQHVQANRLKATEENTFVYAEHRLADNIATFWDTVRDFRDNTLEILFDLLYL